MDLQMEWQKALLLGLQTGYHLDWQKAWQKETHLGWQKEMKWEFQREC